VKKYGYIVILLAFSISFAGCEKTQEQPETPSDTMLADENVLNALQDEELERFAAELLEGKEPSYAALVEDFGMKLGTVLCGGEDEAGFRIYLLLKGDWLGNPVPVCGFSPEGIRAYGVNKSLSMEQVDVNFDGYDDLLICYGYTYGSGGSWDCYLALGWNEENKQFEEMESFPALVSELDLEKQRVICRYQSGAAEEHVEEYTFSEGEWSCSRELIKCSRWDEEKASERLLLYYYKGKYYEEGELIDVTDVTDMSLEEIGALYPDLDYWWRG